MGAKKLKEFVENYPEVLKRKKKLYQRFIRFSGRDPMREHSIMERLAEINKIENLLLDTDLLTDKELVILDHRMAGRTLKEIGEVFSLSAERIRLILNTIYKKLATEYQKKYGR